jgi:hypothetical protein
MASTTTSSTAADTKHIDSATISMNPGVAFFHRSSHADIDLDAFLARGQEQLETQLKALTSAAEEEVECVEFIKWAAESESKNPLKTRGGKNKGGKQGTETDMW